MAQLDRDQGTQQFTAVEYNEISIIGAKNVTLSQPIVNSFAGADEIRRLFTNLKHGGTPSEKQDEEYGERIRSLTGPHGKRYQRCSLRSRLMLGSEDHGGSAVEPQQNHHTCRGNRCEEDKYFSFQ